MTTTHPTHLAARGNIPARLAPWLTACVGLLVAISPAFCQTAPAATPELKPDFVVSPTGDDAGPGTVEKPFATLARARDAVRDAVREALVKNHDRSYVVALRGGWYPIHKTVVFGLADSARHSRTITYQSWPGETAVLSGGYRMKGWSKTEDANVLDLVAPEARGHLYQVALEPEQPLPNAVFLDDKPLPRAAKQIKPIPIPEGTPGNYWHDASKHEFCRSLTSVKLLPGQVKALD